MTVQMLTLICERHGVFATPGQGQCFRCAEQDGVSISTTGGAPVVIAAAQSVGIIQHTGTTS